MKIEPSKKIVRILRLISVLIPVVVAIMLGMPTRLDLGIWTKNLPFINAIINSLTALFLILAVIFVKLKKYDFHKNLMLLSLVLGTFFLIFYVVYHTTNESVYYGDANGNGILEEVEKNMVSNSRPIYLFILATHILLSFAVVPLVLFSFYYSLSGQLNRHKDIVKYSFPLWLYVSITGVIVYLMISPYY